MAIVSSGIDIEADVNRDTDGVQDEPLVLDRIWGEPWFGPPTGADGRHQ